MNYVSKQDFVSAFEQIINPIKHTLITCEGTPHFGSTAAVYPQNAVYAEAFLRPLWGLVPYWYGGNGEEDLKEGMRRGIIAGTDPASPHYWGKCTRYDQCFVEMAPLAYGLLYVPHILWEPLTEQQKQNLHAWVWQINENVIPTNNWRFFRILVNIAFKHLGRAYSEERLQEDLEGIESYYMDKGWYHDGPHGQRDYYVAWAFHFYGLIYAAFEKDTYAARYRARAKAFAEEFIYWFSDSGAALPYGRSLTYRLAQGSFWSMCRFAGVDIYDDGIVKGILSRQLDDWLSSPIFDNAGILSIGYKYPNLMMAEHYNAPGSPYWATKFFAVLGLDDNDPFWKAESKPLPALESKHLLREADMLVTRHNGDGFAYVGGTIAKAAFGQSNAKYLKFVYSTRFGINLKHGDCFDIEALTDSTLTFDIDGIFCDRRENRGFEISEDGLTIHWSPARGISVTTVITPDETGHTRHHFIDSDLPCVAYDCGFAVANREQDDCHDSKTADAVEIKNNFSLCRVSSACGEPMVIIASPNTNIVYTKTLLPVVKYSIPAGHSEFITRIDVE